MPQWLCSAAHAPRLPQYGYDATSLHYGGVAMYPVTMPNGQVQLMSFAYSPRHTGRSSSAGSTGAASGMFAEPAPAASTSMLASGGAPASYAPAAAGTSTSASMMQRQMPYAAAAYSAPYHLGGYQQQQQRAQPPPPPPPST